MSAPAPGGLGGPGGPGPPGGAGLPPGLPPFPGPMPSPAATRLPGTVAALTALLFIGLLTFSLRIYARLRSRGGLAADDYFVTIGVVFSIVDWALMLSTLTATGVRHILYVPPLDLVRSARTSFIALIFSHWALTSIKISVCLLLYRLYDSRRWRIGLIVLMCVLIPVALFPTIVQLVQCTPIKANWDFFEKSKSHCLDSRKLQHIEIASSSFFVATDVILALLPIVFIRQLARPLQEKILVGFLMALGLVVALCGIMKIVMLARPITLDFTWDSAPLFIWTFAESYTAITAASIPCLKSLLESVLKALHSRVMSSKSDGADPSQNAADDVAEAFPSNGKLNGEKTVENTTTPV